MVDSTLQPDDTAEAAAYLGDMTVVARCLSVNEALTLKGCLVAAGIPAVVGDQNLMMQGSGVLLGGGGGVRVLVPATLVARANETLSELRGGAFELEGDADPDLPSPTRETDLALWSPDLSAFLGLWLTPVFGATLHWMNSRKLAQPELARSANFGLALSVLVTVGAFWLARGREWTPAEPFTVSGLMSVYTAAWYLIVAHSQSRFIAQSFGHKYRHRGVWAAAAFVFAAMLALGMVLSRD